jgi:hypothetical protein
MALLRRDVRQRQSLLVVTPLKGNAGRSCTENAGQLFEKLQWSDT